jgi:hypothetical protein
MLVYSDVSEPTSIFRVQERLNASMARQGYKSYETDGLEMERMKNG